MFVRFNLNVPSLNFQYCLRFFNIHVAMSSSRKCYLLNLETSKRISLPHKELKVIGRNEESEIQDLFVSKAQLELLANVDNCKVKLKPIGKAICGIDGYATVKDKTYTIGHGHRIELRLGYHQHEVLFDPPPPSNDVDDAPVHIPKKQKLDFPIFNTFEGGENKYMCNGKWEAIDDKELFIYTPDNIQPSKKIAGFDIDGTIIKTKSGARFPKDFDDWILNMNNIPQHLTKLYERNYKIVFFTNQSGVGKDSYKMKQFKIKIENIIKRISIPIQVFIATGKSIYRKPAPGMWNVLCNEKNNNCSITLEESFYVGDAAGRDKSSTSKTKDHSCADRLFAMNLGIKFYTPEEFFLKSEPANYKIPAFDPRCLPVQCYPKINFETPNVILMVGGPGSGKSFFCHQVLLPNGYIHINRDKLGTWQKCVKNLEEALQSRRNCVVDNTNLDKESRMRFLGVAKKFNVNCRCLLMDTDFQQCKHNNRFRELTDKTHVPVSDIIINSLKKSYEEPNLSEGFVDIIKVPFVPKFDNEEHEKLYKMFLLEK